jgi:hypothetical protein
VHVYVVGTMCAVLLSAFCTKSSIETQSDVSFRAHASTLLDFVMQITFKLPSSLKEVDDVLGQEEQWANAQKTEGTCHTRGSASAGGSHQCPTAASLVYQQVTAGVDFCSEVPSM